MTVEGSDGQNQERSQDTAHNTRTDTLHTCTRDNFRRTPLSTVDYTKQNRKQHWQQGCPRPPWSTETSRRCLRRDTLRSSFLRPQKQTRRNNKKISLHRFKPVIFSKMIQNCQNQVEDGGYSRLIRERGRHRGREDRKALDRESVVCKCLALTRPSSQPRDNSPRGPQWSPAVAALGVCPVSLFGFPTGVAGWVAWRVPGVLARGASLVKPCNRRSAMHCLPFTAQRSSHRCTTD